MDVRSRTQTELNISFQGSLPAAEQTREGGATGAGLATGDTPPELLPDAAGLAGQDFASLVPEFAAGSSETSGNVDEVVGKLATALENVAADADGALDALSALLGDLGIGDDLSTLLIEFAAMGRQNALDQRLASREQAKSELMAQAETTRASAITQAVVAGIALVASVASFGVSASGASAASKTSDAVADAVAAGGDQATLTALNTSAAATQAGNQAATQAINMTGQLAQGTGSLISGNMQADGQVDAANAQIEQSNSDLAKKVMDDFEEVVRATIQFLKEMQQAETDLMANMTRV